MAASIGASLNVVMPTCDAVGASSQLSFTVYRPATLTMSVPVTAADAAAVSPADSSDAAAASASAAPSASSGATSMNERITLMGTSLNSVVQPAGAGDDRSHHTLPPLRRKFAAAAAGGAPQPDGRRGITGSRRCDGWRGPWYTLWCAVRSSRSMPNSLPVLGLRSKRGKLDEDTSSRMR